MLTSRIAAIEAAFGRPLPINIHSLKKFAGINATLAGLERYRSSSVEDGQKWYRLSRYEKTERQREIIHSFSPDSQPESFGSAAGFCETGGGCGPGDAAGLEGSRDGVGGGRSCGVGMVAGSNGFGAVASGTGDVVRPALALSRTFL